MLRRYDRPRSYPWQSARHSQHPLPWHGRAEMRPGRSPKELSRREPEDANSWPAPQFRISIAWSAPSFLEKDQRCGPGHGVITQKLHVPPMNWDATPTAPAWVTSCHRNRRIDGGDLHIIRRPPRHRGSVLDGRYRAGDRRLGDLDRA